jgi:hypothetical protein
MAPHGFLLLSNYTLALNENLHPSPPHYPQPVITTILLWAYDINFLDFTHDWDQVVLVSFCARYFIKHNDQCSIHVVTYNSILIFYGWIIFYCTYCKTKKWVGPFCIWIPFCISSCLTLLIFFKQDPDSNFSVLFCEITALENFEYMSSCQISLWSVYGSPQYTHQPSVKGTNNCPFHSLTEVPTTLPTKTLKNSHQLLHRANTDYGIWTLSTLREENFVSILILNFLKSFTSYVPATWLKPNTYVVQFLSLFTADEY